MLWSGLCWMNLPYGQTISLWMESGGNGKDYNAQFSESKF
jgi:hypothetical protein